jgi:tight adherence protein C
MSAAVLLAAAAATLAAAGIVELASAALAARVRVGGSGAGVAGRSSPARAARRRVLVARLAAVGRRAGPPGPPADLGARLDAAGLRPGVTPADVMALKCGAALVGLAAALALAAAAPGRLGVLLLLGAPPAAFLAPDLWLRRRARRRGEQMADELADVAALLRVAVEAGLPPSRALAEVGRRHPGLLAAELRAAAARVAFGVPYADVLDLLARRCPAESVGVLTGALRRAQRHGAPLGPALEALAADARAHRARRIATRAARAAPKVQLVVALLLVPAVMLLVAAALLAGLT